MSLKSVIDYINEENLILICPTSDFDYGKSNSRYWIEHELRKIKSDNPYRHIIMKKYIAKNLNGVEENIKTHTDISVLLGMREEYRKIFNMLVEV